MSGKLTEQEKFEQIIEDTEERFWKLYGDPDIEQLPNKPISYRKWEVLINNYETNDLLYDWSWAWPFKSQLSIMQMKTGWKLACYHSG